MKTVRLFGIALLIAVAAAVVGGEYWWNSSKRDVLRHIVLEQCVPNQRNNHLPAPCAQVDEQQGFVVLKDMNGPLQYLLMPTARITGMESPALLELATWSSCRL
jgi:CDP-diacylglycerol pyrophosphatase